MNEFGWVRASLGVGIVPDWLFWLIVWWAGWFSILLIWYDRAKKERLHPLAAFLMFVMVGFIPIIAIVWIIKKAGQDK